MGVVVGVDGRRGGWAVAVVDDDLGVAWHSVDGQDAAGLGAVLRQALDAGARAIGVDCPLGLPSSDWRPCDLLAKRRLGRAAARVFLAPPRPVLAARSYPDARAVARRMLDGRGVSAQTYGLRRIVLAVDDAVRAGLPGADLVVEVHPELSFMAMLDRSPGDPLPSKRTPEGRAARLAAAAAQLDRSAGGPVVGHGRQAGLLAAPDGDDHLDALAAAWSAARWAAGTAEVLGGDVDAYGLPMRIVI